MEMKLNAEKVTSLRQSKAWSQQQLSEICDLSLRTIQRVEKSGNGSPETVQSIAAAFGVGVDVILSESTKESQAVSVLRFWHSALGKVVALVGAVFSVTLFVPLTTASEVAINAEEIQALDNLAIYRGNVEISIPAGREAEVFAEEMWTSGNAHILQGDVSVRVEGMTISFNKGTLYKSENGLKLNTEYAERLESTLRMSE